MRTAFLFCLVLALYAQQAYAQETPHECEKQHADPYYTGRISRLIAQSLICEVIAPESAASVERVLAIYRSEDPACWDAIESMLLEDEIFHKEFAGYVKNHNSGKRPAELVQLAVSECRDIEADDEEYRSLLRSLPPGG